MNSLMLSCRKATFLIEKKSEEDLKWLEKMQLFFHTRMCDACLRYAHQSHLLDEAFTRHSNGNAEILTPLKPLSNEVKEKIIRKIQEQ